MVGRVVTKVSNLYPQKLVQVGPLMRTYKLFRPEAIRDNMPTNVDVAPLRAKYVEHGALSMSWMDSTSIDHKAKIERVDRIWCDYCTPNESKPIVWCQHLQYLARTGKDAPLYRSEAEFTTLVPIIPTEGLFVPVTVRKFSEEYNLRELFVTLDTLGAGAGDEGEHSLGVVGATFGMLEIRAMYYDFINGWLASEQHFYQEGVPSIGGARPPEYVAEMDRINAQFSPLTQRFFLGSMGKTIGEIEIDAQSAGDPPSF